MTPEMEVATKYQSHLPALLACIVSTTGPVLELGVGHFSTPHLHALCGALKRNLVSIERDKEWRDEFEKRYAGSGHAVVSEWVHLKNNGRWGVAFIDDSPGGASRASAFKSLISISDYVVMHDSQADAENFQAVQPMLAGLNWHLCTSIFPHTLVASKTLKIPDVVKQMVRE